MGVKNKKANSQIQDQEEESARRFSGTAERPRMTVFRSNKQIYVQLDR